MTLPGPCSPRRSMRIRARLLITSIFPQFVSMYFRNTIIYRPMGSGEASRHTHARCAPCAHVQTTSARLPFCSIKTRLTSRMSALTAFGGRRLSVTSLSFVTEEGPVSAACSAKGGISRSVVTGSIGSMGRMVARGERHWQCMGTDGVGARSRE